VIILDVLQHVQYSTVVAFAIAIGAVATATLTRYLLTPVFGPSAFPYLFYFAAVAAVGLTGNLAAALFATLLSALAANALFVAPRLGLDIGFGDSIALVAFLITCGAIAGITARLEKALGKTAERERLANDRTEALEQERTNLQRESRRLSLLADVANIGVANPTFTDVAQRAARRVSEEIGESCVIRVREGELLTAVAFHHVEPEARPLLEAAILRPEDATRNPHYRRLVETRRSFILADPPIPRLEGALSPQLQVIFEKYRPRHAIGTPIMIGDEVIGTMSVLRSQPVPYSDADVIAIEAVAARVALAMENARLFDNARREAEEAERARAAAEEASRVKDEFLATLSHELRTPLNAIVGWAHMLRDPDLPEERRNNAVATILRNAQSQEQLISDILEVQRIMAGKLRLDFRSVDLSAIVRSAADTVQPSAEAKRIKLQLLLDLNVTPIWGDPDRLQQVAWNLLSNAIKFTPPSGLVRVRLEQTETDCEMVVEDDGPGIAPEFLPHVFERFRQADSSSTRVHKGLGLGLAITRNLIEMHGGSIEASNITEAGRTGAVFTIRLPRHKGTRTPAAQGVDFQTVASGESPAWVDEGPSLRGIGVLVVDDDADARELVGAILNQYGADVRVAASVDEGMQSLQSRLPHVVVTDIEMPHEDGYAFIRQMRALPDEAGGRLPAAALTAYAGASDRMKVLAAGFNMHVAKPVQPAELAMIVASLAGHAVAQPEATEKR
jgi:signal transduction histidine kinase/ActR/RegA family two-component response regulator